MVGNDPESKKLNDNNARAARACYGHALFNDAVSQKTQKLSH